MFFPARCQRSAGAVQKYIQIEMMPLCNHTCFSKQYSVHCLSNPGLCSPVTYSNQSQQDLRRLHMQVTYRCMEVSDPSLASLLRVVWHCTTALFFPENEESTIQAANKLPMGEDDESGGLEEDVTMVQGSVYQGKNTKEQRNVCKAGRG